MKLLAIIRPALMGRTISFQPMEQADALLTNVRKGDKICAVEADGESTQYIAAVDAQLQQGKFQEIS